MNRKAFAAGCAAALGIGLVACDTPHQHTAGPADPPPPVTTVTAARVAGLGEILVTGAGRTLYMFPPDHGGRVTCTGACAGTWPPLRAPAHTAPHAGAGVRADLLGTAADPDGGRVVTYHGWPLYTYVGDLEPGQATGQALDLNGAPWYVLRPSGTPVHRTAPAS